MSLVRAGGLAVPCSRQRTGDSGSGDELRCRPRFRQRSGLLGDHLGDLSDQGARPGHVHRDDCSLAGGIPRESVLSDHAEAARIGWNFILLQRGSTADYHPGWMAGPGNQRTLARGNHSALDSGTTGQSGLRSEFFAKSGRYRAMTRFQIVLLAVLVALSFSAPSNLSAQSSAETIDGWQMQDSARVSAAGSVVSTVGFHPQSWYPATVPGTVLTTLVNNNVYPEPLYGENMRAIPESLNKTTYWYRTTFLVPASHKGRHTWLHFAGINYTADVWVNGHEAGAIRGAFIRGDFDITEFVKPGRRAVLAVLVAPQPHPGVPHEHTVALGVGQNGGETAIDGPTFLSTIGWDWLPAVRDRDTGIWLPVTLDSTGPVVVKDPFVTTDLSPAHDSADLHVAATLENKSPKPVSGTLTGTIQLQNSTDSPITFRKSLTVEANGKTEVSLDKNSMPEMHLSSPKLWWPNGYGPQNLYTLTLRFDVGGRNSDSASRQFGIRKIEYQVADSENLTLSVNGVRVMARGGNWGLDEALKRIPRERLDAQFHMHALANLNIIRNWVGQSTSPDFYDMADKYGILLWDEFFQPNPADGPNVTDIPTYIANVTDKVVRYRNHPSIAVWCARKIGR